MVPTNFGAGRNGWMGLKMDVTGRGLKLTAIKFIGSKEKGDTRIEF